MKSWQHTDELSMHVLLCNPERVKYVFSFLVCKMELVTVSTELRGRASEALRKHMEGTREAASSHDTNGDLLHHLQHLESRKWASSRVAVLGKTCIRT